MAELRSKQLNLDEKLEVTVTDTDNNDITDVARFAHDLSSGTATAGIGAALTLEAPDAGGTMTELLRIEAEITDATAYNVLADVSIGVANVIETQPMMTFHGSDATPYITVDADEFWVDEIKDAGGGQLLISSSSVILEGNSGINGGTLILNTGFSERVTGTAADEIIYKTALNNRVGASANGFGYGIKYQGRNGSSQVKDYCTIDTSYTDVTNGSEDAKFDFKVLSAGAEVTPLTIDGDGIATDSVKSKTYPGDITIDCGSQKTATLANTVWDDLRIVPGAFQFAGSGDPTLSSWQPGGGGTTFKVYKFKTYDEVFFTCQLPHTYKEGTDLEAHVHWTPGDRGIAESGKTVNWALDYTWTNVNGVFDVSSNIAIPDTCSGTSDQHEIASSVTITGTSKNISSMLVCRLYRDAGDTWVGTTSGESPALLEFDLHYEIDTLGSRQEIVK